jgi:GxxExxY protein
VEKSFTHDVIGAAYEVHSLLGSGYLESVYENALAVELLNRGFTVERQVPLDVIYKGCRVGHYRVDMVVDNQLVIELKANRGLKVADEVQLVNYLTAMKIGNGILLNFSEGGVQVKRKYRTYKDRKKDTGCTLEDRNYKAL